MAKITEVGKRIAAETVDAYSRERYTDYAWQVIAEWFVKRGFSEAETKWVLESKTMRWAADHANRRHSVSFRDWLAYFDAPNGMNGEKGLAKVHAEAKRETRPAPAADGNTLAGNCEGEDIAELIDIVTEVAKGNARSTFHGTTLVSRAQVILNRIKARG